MAFSSLAEIDNYMKENTCEFWEAVIREEARDSQQPEMDIVNRMTQMYRAMKEADETYDDTLTSHSGLSGKNGKRMADYAATHKCMCGEFGGAVMARAIKMAESNACMKRIVAAAMALKSLLGLVCDPVAGLVEVPCVKRNASGAMNALCAVDMALAGIESAIPADEVIDAMREVGDLMHKDLRETGKEGLAATATGIAIAEQL